MFCTSVFFWSFGLAMLTLAPNLKAANLFYYIHYFGAIPIPLTFLNFIHHYILRTKEITFDLIFSSFMTLLILYLFVIGDLCAPRAREFALLSSLRVTRVIEATSLGLDTPFDENKGIRLDLISL